jgi:glycosyltransferase involved in cell wall biosynthesis
MSSIDGPGREASPEPVVTPIISPGTNPRRRVAIVHDWLPLYGGAERVLEQILNVFPEADLFTMVDFIPGNERGFLKNKPAVTSFVQRLPGAKSRYRSYLPLMPIAVEQFDLENYDLVISSSYAVAKGVITGPEQLHICYCHSPIRYAWDLEREYLRTSGLDRGLRGLLARALLHYIRIWDLRTVNGVDHFIANSNFVGGRIRKFYGRTSTVIHPPVDTERFQPADEREDFYLTASRFVPYKKIDTIVEAFARMPGRRLLVVGDGPDYWKIKRAAGDNVEMLGAVEHSHLVKLMQRARAFVFAAKEDFGIVPVEAQACGTPVIAFGQGGVTESVIDGKTGIFFDAQTPESIAAAIGEFEVLNFDSALIRENADRFGPARFRRELSEFVEAKWAEFRRGISGNGCKPPERLLRAIANA